jgi:hypothetical protein
MTDLTFLFSMQLSVAICYSETFPSGLHSKDNPLATQRFRYYLMQKSKVVVCAGARVDTRTVRVEFLEKKTDTRTGLSPSSIFPCQYHFTNTPHSFI